MLYPNSPILYFSDGSRDDHSWEEAACEHSAQRLSHDTGNFCLMTKIYQHGRYNLLLIKTSFSSLLAFSLFFLCNFVTIYSWSTLFLVCFMDITHLNPSHNADEFVQ